MLADRLRFSPGHLLLTAVVLVFAACLAATVYSVRQPWLGIELQSDGQGVRVVSVAAQGPSAALAPLLPGGDDDRALYLEAVGGIALDPRDLLEDPDFVTTYAEMRTIFERQGRMAAALAAGPVELTLARAGGARFAQGVTPAAARPVSDLPPVFWFQLFAGSACLLVGAWVWALRPGALSTQMFALTGMGVPFSAVSAAIYSSRELALDGTVFRLLSGLNHLGALLFGAALACLFLCYPQRLVPARYLLLVPAVFLPWLVADLAQLAPDVHWGARVPMFLAIVLVLAFAWVQWRRAAADARARAALRWLSLSVIVGCGLFLLSIAATSLLGWLPPLKQGYAFGFFLVMYGGLALGLRRYRLFELDEWAFRILLWVGGAVALVLLDGLLLLALRLEPIESLGVALLVTGFLYLPVRNALWSALVERRRIPDDELVQGVMEVAFKATDDDRANSWRSLVQRVFDPLEIEALAQAGGGSPFRLDGTAPAAADDALPRIGRDGLEMRLPAAAASPPLAVRFPMQGRELFGNAHLRLARQMVEMMRHADAGRAAYERGAAEERRRVARDLHDDLGALLLSALSRRDLDETRATIRDAIAEMRDVVAGLSGERAELGVLLANLRHETASRLEGAGIELDWPLPEGEEEQRIDYLTGRHLASVHRELVSNVIRHAKATRVGVSIKVRQGWLSMKLSDDGVGPAQTAAVAVTPGHGHGLRNLERRVADLGGNWSMRESRPGTLVEIDLPIAGDGGRA